MDSQLAPITNGGETAVDVRNGFRAAFFSVAPQCSWEALTRPSLQRLCRHRQLVWWPRSDDLVITGYLLAAQ